MGTVIVVTSGKGGTGKTTTVGAVGSCLAAEGRSVLCLDCDLGLKNLDLALGMSDLAVKNFYDVMVGDCPLETAAAAHPDIPGLYLLTAPVDIFPEDLDRAQFGALIQAIRQQYDYCLIDSPAGIGGGFALAAAFADRAIVVATADVASLRDAQRAVMELEALGIEDVRLVANRVVPKLLKRSGETIDDIIDITGAQLLGLVPEDKEVTLAANRGAALVLSETKGAAVAFLHIARRIQGRDVPLWRVK